MTQTESHRIKSKELETAASEQQSKQASLKFLRAMNHQMDILYKNDQAVQEKN